MAHKTVSEVAALAGVSVRALHHYDEIGLLRPSERTEAGYRLDPADFAEEAEARWGHTPAWEEARRRTRRYREAEWRAIKEEQQAVNARLAALVQAGADPSEPAALEAAKAHREHLERWFYTVTPEIHQGLGDLYVSDPRFRATYEAVTPGLATFLRDAIHALYAPRQRTL